MSSVINTIFGGSKSNSSSNNQAYPWAQQNFGGAASAGYNGGMGALANILGIGGGGGTGGTPGTPGTFFDLTHDGIPGNAAAARKAGQPTSGYTPGTPGTPGTGGGTGGDALSNFFNSSGGNFLLNEGTKAVNANMASRGLLDSGADMKGLETFRQGLASTKLQDYIGNLGNFAKLGLGGGSLVTDAGQQSSGSGNESSGGLGKFLGAALAFI